MAEEITLNELEDRTIHLAKQDLKILELIEKFKNRIVEVEDQNTRIMTGIAEFVHLLLLLNTRVSRLEAAMEPISVEDVLDGKTRPFTGMTDEEIEELGKIKSKLESLSDGS